MLVCKIGDKESGFPILWEEAPQPEILETQVLVKIASFGINRADLIQRIGKYPPPPGVTEVLGLEASGEVVAVGSSVPKSLLSKRVACLLSGGAYAQYCAIDYRLLLEIPDSMSFEQAAAIPEVFITAYFNLFTIGNLGSNQSILIHGGASGVGTAAIQLAKISGARVVTTVGTRDKKIFTEEIGADLSICYKDLEPQVDFGDREFDIILDMVGAKYVDANLKALRQKGKLIWIAFLSGKECKADIQTVMSKQLMLTGSTLRSQDLSTKISLVENFKRDFWPQILSGKIRPVIDSIGKVAEIEDFHARMKQNLNMGKLVITLG